MKLNEMTLDPNHIRALCSFAAIVEKEFPNTEVSLENGNILFTIPEERGDADNTLLDIEQKLNHDMSCQCSVERIDNYAVVKLLPFWEGEMLHNNLAMRKVVLNATRNNIPEDTNLKKQLKVVHNFRYNHHYIEDGIGINGDTDSHKIDFKIEVVKYDYTSYRTVPSLWIAFGSVDGYYIELLAGSEAHAFAKIIKAIYRRATKVNPWFANQIYENKIPWRSYGYCY